MKDERTYKLAEPSFNEENNRVFIIRDDKDIQICDDAIEIKNALEKEKERLELQKKLKELKVEAEKCPHIICIEKDGWIYSSRICVACGGLVDTI